LTKTKDKPGQTHNEGKGTALFIIVSLEAATTFKHDGQSEICQQT
jgi:hypothetical protein